MTPQFSKIASYTNPHEAEVVRGLLQDHGIEAILQDNMSVHMNWLYSNAIGGVKLLVPSDQEAMAREILELGVPEEVGTLDECPNCGSHELKDLRPPFIFAIFMFLFMVPFGYRRDRHECCSCGTTW